MWPMVFPEDTETATDGARRFAQDLARHTRTARALGVLLSAVAIVPTLWEQGRLSLPWIGVLLALNLLVWPQLAYLRTRRSGNAMRTEAVNLWLDALYCGGWIALMQGVLVPSVALVMATSLTNASMSGPRGLVVSWVGHATGVLLGSLSLGWGFAPDSSNLAVLSSLPLIMGYPLLMACFMHRTNLRLNTKRRELRFLSEHDALSGVHNRRFFDQTLRQVFSQFQRHERALSLLVGDVDDFKRINDSQGHAAGDGVIRRFGEALTRNARGGDVVARLGGDEFVVLLFDTDAEQAFHYARRVQTDMGNVSISFGVATARRSMKNHEHWLDQADKALYRSKAHDRGGVSLAGAADEAAG